MLRRFSSGCGICLIDVCRFLLIILLGCVMMVSSAGSAEAAPRMRPYTGIGLFVFADPESAGSQDMPLQMYDEPGISRVGVLDRSRTSENEWIFAVNGPVPLIVSARKGEWLKVYYDDAGREAWIEPQNYGRFESWEQFLKMQAVRMLPGLPPQQYQLLQQPGGKMLDLLTPKHLFRILKLENCWGMILTEQSQIGWVRWCDDDGRLMVGAGKK